MDRFSLVAVAVAVPLILAQQPSPSWSQPFDVELDIQAEIKAANDALDNAHGAMGGMGGLGVIPEPDLSTIHDMLSAGENMLRDARRRAVDAKSPQDQIRVIGYARAGRAMIEAANEYRSKRGYQ